MIADSARSQCHGCYWIIAGREIGKSMAGFRHENQIRHLRVLRRVRYAEFGESVRLNDLGNALCRTENLQCLRSVILLCLGIRQVNQRRAAFGNNLHARLERRRVRGEQIRIEQTRFSQEHVGMNRIGRSFEAMVRHDEQRGTVANACLIQRSEHIA